MKLYQLLILAILLGILVEKGIVRNQNPNGQRNISYEVIESTGVR